ncbi:Mitochondrial dicarboxylate transporter [Tulasnella sp. 419]|nr:Mitochondrial dicarboxylate transporter [Tulasnella sp. 419]
MAAGAPFWLGVAAACTHPLDVTKMRMQTMPVVEGNTRPGMIWTLRKSIHKDGVSSIYQGISAALLRQLTYSMVRIGSYEGIKAKITNGKKPSTSQLVLAGALAGGLGGIAGNPADIVLVRMTSDAVLPPNQRRCYGHAIDGVLRIVREEGTTALARGIVPNTIRAMLMTSSQMASYDVCKQFLMTNSSFQFKDGPWLHFVSSSVAGLVATTVCSPADVIKSKVMAHKNGNIVEVIRTSLRNEGPRFLFAGWTPSFIRLAPNTVLLFIFLEQLKKSWKQYAA